MKWKITTEMQRNWFNFLWRDKYSLIPPLDCMPSELRDKLKEFAWNIYKDQFEPNHEEEPHISHF